MDRTRSTFRVLHTPVTFAPNDLAICTVNVPTPPAAPFTRTFCPASIRALSRRPCNAVRAATGADAACSNVTLSGLTTSADFMPVTDLEVAYSAKARSEEHTSELQSLRH